MMDTLAVVLEDPEQLDARIACSSRRRPDDVVVDIAWSGISTGTERLLYTGQMPTFPGMGYPLVPGYESVGRVARRRRRRQRPRSATRVFVPGARCFGDVRGLFGGAARAASSCRRPRVQPIDEDWGENAVLLALAATARHALAAPARPRPTSSSAMAFWGGCWPVSTIASRRSSRRPSGTAIRSAAPARPATRSSTRPPTSAATTASIYDVSGDAAILDTLVQRLAPGGEIVLAGFYAAPLSLAFPPAFMREARFRVAAEWRQPDLDAVRGPDPLRPARARRPDHAPRATRRGAATPTAPPSATRPASR